MFFYSVMHHSPQGDNKRVSLNSLHSFHGERRGNKRGSTKRRKETGVAGHKEKLPKSTEYRNQQRKIVRKSGKMEQD